MIMAQDLGPCLEEEGKGGGEGRMGGEGRRGRENGR